MWDQLVCLCTLSSYQPRGAVPSNGTFLCRGWHKRDILDYQVSNKLLCSPHFGRRFLICYCGPAWLKVECAAAGGCNLIIKQIRSSFHLAQEEFLINICKTVLLTFLRLFPNPFFLGFKQEHKRFSS